jgi:thiol-disulfide isomerase/thioredoxin
MISKLLLHIVWLKRSTLCLLLGLLCACSDPGMPSVQGGKIDLQALRGKWVFINYWADWCEPCLQEIPELNAFHLANKQQAAVVLGVNYDHLSATKLRPLIKKMAIDYPVLLNDPATELGFSQVEQLPTTVVISPSGRYHSLLQGPQTRAQLTAVMDEMGAKNLSSHE